MGLRLTPEFYSSCAGINGPGSELDRGPDSQISHKIIFAVKLFLWDITS